MSKFILSFRGRWQTEDGEVHLEIAKTGNIPRHLLTEVYEDMSKETKKLKMRYGEGVIFETIFRLEKLDPNGESFFGLDLRKEAEDCGIDLDERWRIAGEGDVDGDWGIDDRPRR